MYQRRLYEVVTFLKRFKSSREKPDVAYYIPEKGFRPPYYHLLKPQKDKSKDPFPPFPNAGDSSGMGPRLYDYQVMSELVRSLPTVSERIDFVNPYERDFTRREKRFHRPWQARLLKTRKAWGIRPLPNYFDSLNFYQYLTKTRCIEGLSQWYENSVPLFPEGFEERLAEMLRQHLESGNSENEQERTTKILRSLLDLLIEIVVQDSNYTGLADQRVSYTSRCESFWIRCGFDALYENSKMFKHRGDNRAKLGELAFVLRDTFAAQVRTKEPLKPLVSFLDDETTKPLFGPTFDIKNELIYSPAIFGLTVDAEPLWQCPGYEPDCGEEYKYGQIGFKQFNDLDGQLKMWKVKGEEAEVVRNECLKASATVSLFSWLNAQAHALGFTQYNDIEYPLVSQLILSDGKQFFFAIAQLNTLLINVNIEGIINNRSNLCFVEGPLTLYDEYDSGKGTFQFFPRNSPFAQVSQFNPQVLGRLMQMLVKDLPTKKTKKGELHPADSICTISSIP